MVMLGPRLVVAGTHSGVGKTTVATGLMAAYARRGVAVASAKVGPDFIDPGYHSLATGRPGRNLDAWICGPDAMGPLAGRAGADSDLLIVEGVMGAFDGAVDGAPSSTADVAALIDAPIVLVVDASGMSSSIAAVVHGFSTLDPRISVAGVIANRVGSERHAGLLRDALESLGVPLLGALMEDDAFSWRDRHLGLVPVVERPAEVRAALQHLADAVEAGCNLDALERLAATAPETIVADVALPVCSRRVRLALATGQAFSFLYEDNVEALIAAGAEMVPFDPCVDTRIPEGCDGVIAGGGFPEVYADALADNVELLADVRRFVEVGGVVWAECGGLLWLGQHLDDRPMAGVVPTAARMTSRLTLGYRQAQTTGESPFGAAGRTLRGHEFHYSSVEPRGVGLASPTGVVAATWLSPRVFASYLHLHLGNDAELAAEFVRRSASGGLRG
ncbi:MAG TPA: cobyrinate a,c-diamide synthase [Acidimicrobiia bacterium]|nr:cobyrinate a,c-diamide synthase [Acidimicrobiia bacterium]